MRAIDITNRTRHEAVDRAPLASGTATPSVRRELVAMRALLALLVTIGLTSCVPLADHPAADEHAATFDERLRGIWRSLEDPPFLMFAGSADETERGVHLVLVQEARDRRWNTQEYDGLTMRRGDHGFLSVRWEPAGDERHGWVVVRYELVGRDRLRVATPNPDALAALVRAGKIPGRAPDGLFADVDLTMGSDELIAFLESKEGTGVFGASHDLVRVAQAERPSASRRPSTRDGRSRSKGSR